MPSEILGRYAVCICTNSNAAKQASSDCLGHAADGIALSYKTPSIVNSKAYSTRAVLVSLPSSSALTAHCVKCNPLCLHPDLVAIGLSKIGPIQGHFYGEISFNYWLKKPRPLLLPHAHAHAHMQTHALGFMQSFSGELKRQLVRYILNFTARQSEVGSRRVKYVIQENALDAL